MRKTILIMLRCCMATLVLPMGWGIVLDSEALCGEQVAAEPSAGDGLATIYREDFESFTSDQDLLNAGWEVQHGQFPATDGGIWHIDDEPMEGGAVIGVYVISNSHEEGELPSPQYIDERLISPEIDCADFTEVHLEFIHNLKVWPQDFAEVFNVHISSDPGHTNWQSNKVPFWSQADGSSYDPQSIDISNFADGAKIKIRWRYTSSWDYWWAIDEVRVCGRPNVLVVTGIQVNLATDEVTVSWNAPGGSFSIEASSDIEFSWPTELATGITQKQWTGTDPGLYDKQRFYKVRMD